MRTEKIKHRESDIPGNVHIVRIEDISCAHLSTQDVSSILMIIMMIVKSVFFNAF